jgi:hypothetical protein
MLVEATHLRSCAPAVVTLSRLSAARSAIELPRILLLLLLLLLLVCIVLPTPAAPTTLTSAAATAATAATTTVALERFTKMRGVNDDGSASEFYMRVAALA